MSEPSCPNPTALSRNKVETPANAERRWNRYRSRSLLGYADARRQAFGALRDRATTRANIRTPSHKLFDDWAADIPVAPVTRIVMGITPEWVCARPNTYDDSCTRDGRRYLWTSRLVDGTRGSARTLRFQPRCAARWIPGAPREPTGRPKATLSSRVTELEGGLGLRLFERGARGSHAAAQEEAERSTSEPEDCSLRNR